MKQQNSVLVVDDNQDLVDTFSLILKLKGYHVETAYDGEAAVNKIKENNFDIVLMDVIMPRMNGIEALHKIRQMNGDARVILMTAYSDEEALNQAVDDGAYCTLKKPVNIGQLMKVLSEAVTNPVILLVDDDKDFSQTLAKVIELQGFQVAVARDGNEALALVRQVNCGIALVDYKMPLMDGVQTYLKLREINSNLAAIMMTGYHNEMRDSAEKALVESEVACLYKPFDVSQALSMIDKMSRKARRKRIGREEKHSLSR